MKRILLAFAMLCSAASAHGLAAESIRRGSVVVVPIDGAVSDAQFYFLRRVVKNAESSGAAAVILDMDTPGGALKSTESIVQMLMKSPVPSYTYVDPNAGSAGALIALATKKVFMAPVSAIGAAAPVVGGGQEIPATMNAKMVSYFSGYFRSVAERNGYHPQLVDGFMNLDKEVKIGTEVINPKGALLTLSAQEATREIGGKPLLATAIAKDIGEICTTLGLDPLAVVRVAPTGFEVLSQWITALAPIFMLGAILGAYLEIKTPGFGVAGVLSAVCLVLFFGGHYIAGLSGLEVAAVFGLGLLLVIAEVVFFPGVMVMLLSGVVLMFAALFFAMVDFYPAQPIDLSFDVMWRPMLNFGLAAAGAVLGISLLARYLPDLPVFRRLFLSATLPAGPSIPVRASESIRFPRPGETGLAESPLRPAGRAVFSGVPVDVTTDGVFVPAGERVRVVVASGPRVVVEPATGGE